MKNSERNLAVIENFILFLTHSGEDESDPNYREPQTYTPEELYRVAFDYIEEDHVYGKDNPEDFKSEETRAKEVLKSKGYYVDNLWQIDDVKSRFTCTDEQAMEVLNETFNNDASIDQLWFSLDFSAEEKSLKRKYIIFYNGEEYQTRTFVVNIDGVQQEIKIAPEKLLQALEEIKTKEQIEVDNEIYFYLDSRTLFSKTGKEICKKYLDEPLEYVEEV